MNWLFPGFLVGTVALALPLLLHLLRRRPKRTIAFPSLRFLVATQQQNDRSQRVRRWLVLLLRCAALALLAAAFARPYFGARSFGDRQAVVIVIDNSFSLQAAQRWTALRQWAREQVGELARGDQVGVLLTTPRPIWLAPLNSDPAAALALLDKLSPGWESARVEPALRLGADTLVAASADRRRLIFVGDHQRVGWAGTDFGKKFPPGVRAVFPGVPAALVRQAALRAPTVTRTREGFHLAVPVQNFTGAQDRTLRVYRDGAPTPAAQTSIALAERANEIIPVDLRAGVAPDAAHFRVTLDADDLPADDQAFAVWQASGERTVLLDSPPGTTDYVGAALNASARLSPSLQIAPLPASAWPPQAVAVLRNDSSFAGETATRLSAFLRGGGSVLIFVDGSAAQSAWLQTAGIKLRALKADIETLEVRDWAMDHALVHGLAAHSVRALLDWKFRRAWALPADAVEPIALWSESGAAIGETSGSAGRMLICGFAPDRRNGEWPAREVFVPFIHRTVAYLLGSRTGAGVRPAQVGEALALPAESGTWRALSGPSAGARVDVRGEAVIASAPGVYEFNAAGHRKPIAVNLAPEESDPAAWLDGTPWDKLASDVPVAIAARGTPLGSVEAEQRAPLWWWLVAAMAFVMLAELGLANRTTR